MRESGVVTKLDKNSATVKVNRKDECSKCGMCGMKENMPSIEFICGNGVKAVKGDAVIIETKKDTRLLAAIMVFLVPLVLLAITILISYKFITSEIWILFLCLGIIILWYTILAIIDKKLSKIHGFCPEIVEIITKNDSNNSIKGENDNECNK